MVVARRVGIAVAVAALLVTAACAGDEPASTPPVPEPTPTFSSYVAMGDSYVAGPGIDPVDPVSKGCQRSLNNWPTLLAKQLNIPSLMDISCSGASSADIYQARTGPTAQQATAQLDAVSADTALVTLGVGGNDDGVFGKIIYACATGSRMVSSMCSPAVNTFLAPALARTTQRVASALERIRAKAPHARIVLVGYLRALADPGGCVISGITPERTVSALTAQRMLDQSLADAAKLAGVEYVSLDASSAGHESCAGVNSWVNGMHPVAGDGALLHPTAAGMRAVADVVAKHLR